MIPNGPSDAPAGNQVGCPPSGGGCDSPQHLLVPVFLRCSRKKSRDLVGVWEEVR